MEQQKVELAEVGVVPSGQQLKIEGHVVDLFATRRTLSLPFARLFLTLLRLVDDSPQPRRLVAVAMHHVVGNPEDSLTPVSRGRTDDRQGPIAEEFLADMTAHDSCVYECHFHVSLSGTRPGRAAGE